MAWVDQAWEAGPWCVYAVLIGPAPLPMSEVSSRRRGRRSTTSRPRGETRAEGLAPSVLRSSMRELLNGMSLEDKRALVEAMLGVSLPSLAAGLDPAGP